MNKTLVAWCVAAIVAGLSSTAALGQETFTFRMSGGSMKPTIAPDAVLTIAKYGSDSPSRGDIIAFQFPSDPTTFFIKRLIGYPADKVQMIAGALHINGKPAPREQMADFSDKGLDGKPLKVRRWRETLPNATVYETLDVITGSPLDDTPLIDIPAGQYFVLGDNRDYSTDSRVTPQVGLIPLENIVGHVTRH